LLLLSERRRCQLIAHALTVLIVIYAVIWGQCSKAMKAKLTSLDDLETKSHKSDCVWILKEIKGITYCFEGQRYIYLSLNNARTSYYAYTQGAEDSISSYLEHFRSLVEVLEHYGGAIGEDPGLLDATAAVSSDTDNATKRLKIARDRTLALAHEASRPLSFWHPLGQPREPVLPRKRPVSHQLDRSLQPACQFQASQAGRAAPQCAQLGSGS